MTLNTVGESVHTPNWLAHSVLAFIMEGINRKIGAITPSVRNTEAEKFSPEKFLATPVLNNSRLMDLSLQESGVLINYVLEHKLLEEKTFLASFWGSLEVALAFVARELARKGFKISDEAKAYFDKIDNKFSNDFLSGIWAQAN